MRFNKRNYALLVIFPVILLTCGCCRWRTRGRAFGRLETFVVFSEKPCKCPSPRHTYGLQAKVGQVVHLYPREVFFNRLNFGASGRKVELVVVDTTGEPVTPANVATVSPSEFTTDSKGFGPGLTVSSSVQGVFQIRAAFSDKRSAGIAYSMPIRFFP